MVVVIAMGARGSSGGSALQPEQHEEQREMGRAHGGEVQLERVALHEPLAAQARRAVLGRRRRRPQLLEPCLRRDSIAGLSEK